MFITGNSRPIKKESTMSPEALFASAMKSIAGEYNRIRRDIRYAVLTCLCTDPDSKDPIMPPTDRKATNNV